MGNDFVSFDKIKTRVTEALAGAYIPEAVDRLYVVRNLFGKVRISVSEKVGDNESCRAALQELAGKIGAAAGKHGHGPDETGVLYLSDGMFRTLPDDSEPMAALDRVHWVERLVTGGDWWTVGDPPRKGKAKRWTLFSVKGGVGRSTTAAVLARHLARGGERVLVVDLDLESPGLSSAMLEPDARPEFGIVDWFVEDLVGQGDRVIEDMTASPGWARDLKGDARVAPAHGADPGEYLAKLGRVYMDRRDDPWATRLGRMLDGLEARFDPTVVLLDSRSGLHDIAAAAVTDIDAHALLFATDSEAGWADYGVLFRHWRERGVADSIRERLAFVSALTPPKNWVAYLHMFKGKTWELFRDHLSETPDSSPVASGGMSSGAQDGDSPRAPIPIFWNDGLAAETSLRDPGEAAAGTSHRIFFDRFASLAGARGEEPTRLPAPGALSKSA